MNADDMPAIVTLGEVLLDFIAPDAPDLDAATTFVKAAGGAPANVAVAAARFGQRAAFIGAVGQDPFGSSILSTLRGYGVMTDYMQVVSERTTLAFVARNAGGIPDFVFYRRADTLLDAARLPLATIDAAHVVHVSSLPLTSPMSARAVLETVDRVRQGNALLSVDPNLRPSTWPSVESAVDAVAPLLAAADVLKVNDEEARLLTGDANAETALDSLYSEGRLLLITLGSSGCLWRWNDQRGAVPAPAVSAVDTTGAGDAFTGAVLAELCRLNFTGPRFRSLDGDDVKAILRVATAAGALACTRTGAMASLPDRAQVDAMLAES